MAATGRDGAVDPAAFLNRNGYHLDHLRARVLPVTLLEEIGITRSALRAAFREAGVSGWMGWPPTHINARRATVDAIVAQKLEALNERRRDLEAAATRYAGDLLTRLEHGRTASNQPLSAIHLKEALLELAQREIEATDPLWQTFQRVSDATTDIGDQMSALSLKLAGLWPQSAGAWLAFLCRPGQGLQVWRTWQRLRQHWQAYRAHLGRQAELTIAILRADLVVHFLHAAAAQIEQIENPSASDEKPGL